MQGICKFGFYELFKNIYSGLIGEENTFLYRTTLYLAASASAEFFADIALSPMESAKVCKIVNNYSMFFRFKNLLLLNYNQSSKVLVQKYHCVIFTNR